MIKFFINTYTCAKLFATIVLFFLPTGMLHAQNDRISLNVNGLNVKQVLEEIETKSKYTFFYNDAVLDTNPKINLQVNNERIDVILSRILPDASFMVDKKKVIITSKSKTESLSSVRQEMKVRGKVRDENGEPLPGATIVIEGSTKGVSTDVDGSYSIEVKPADKLIFSFIGMESQTIAVGSQMVIDVQMKPKANELDEVTVVAFAKQKKESVVASISTINPTELKIPSSNLTTAFAGRIAGLISYQRTGEPGMDNADFFIRGVTTFGTGKVDPLILVDK